jgi:hypothetical protein
MLPVAPGRQLQPGSFEHAVNHLVDHCIDRSVFEPLALIPLAPEP